MSYDKELQNYRDKLNFAKPILKKPDNMIDLVGDINNALTKIDKYIAECFRRESYDCTFDEIMDISNKYVIFQMSIDELLEVL